MTELNTTLADEYFHRGGDVVPTLQFRMNLAKEMVENNIGMDANDDGRPTSAASVTTIFCCDP